MWVYKRRCVWQLCRQAISVIKPYPTHTSPHLQNGYAFKQWRDNYTVSLIRFIQIYETQAFKFKFCPSRQWASFYIYS